MSKVYYANPLKNAVSVVNFLNIRNQSLPQLFRRQVLVLSAHQIVIGKELDIGLSNLQAPPSFTYRLVKMLASGSIPFSISLQTIS